MLKKIVTAALALSLVVGATSCGKKEISSTTSDLEKGNVSYPLNVDEKLTVWVNLPTQVSSVVSNYGETTFAKHLKEATGVEVEYIHPTQGQDNALSLLIASGDMPDIVIGYWPLENPSKCIDQNVIYNLNDYIDDYSPNFKKYMSENPDIAKAATTDDGNYYMYPFIRGEVSLGAVSGFMLRADWLDELGLDVPKTIDDWDKVLAGFKEKCEVPFATNRYEMLAGGFGAFADEYVEDGKVKYGPIQENYKNMLEKLHEWYEKGYIDKSYAITDSKNIDANMLNGVSGITFGTGGSKMGTYLSSSKDEKYDLIAAPYPAENNGEKSKFAGTEWQCTILGAAISKNCKHPELAARYLDYGYSEAGHMLYNFGKEGESYDMVDGYPTYKSELLDTTDGVPVAQKLTMNCLGSDSGPFVQDKRYIEQYYRTDRQRNALECWADNDYLDYKIPNVSLTPDENNEFNEIMAEVRTYVSENLNNMIIGKTPIEDFDKYVETLKSMNIERAMEIRQAAYDRYMSK